MKTLLAVLAFTSVFLSTAIAASSPADFTRAYAKPFREAARQKATEIARRTLSAHLETFCVSWWKIRALQGVIA